MIPEQRLKQLAAAARMESLGRVLESPPSLVEVSQLAGKVAEQEATITKEESRSNELAKEVAILRVNLKGQEATIARLTGPLQLFLKYAPLSGDMALMIRASQPGGDEAHNRANKLIEHFEHLNEAHDKGQAALSKQEPAAAKEGE